MTIRAKRKISVCEKCPDYIYHLAKGLTWKDENYQCIQDGFYTFHDGLNLYSGHKSLKFDKYIMWKLPENCRFKLEHTVMNDAE